MIHTRPPVQQDDVMTMAELAEFRVHQARHMLDWLCEMASGSFSRGDSFVEFEKRVKDGLMCLGFSSVIVNVTPNLTAPGLLRKARLEAALQEDFGEPFKSIVDYFDLS